MNALRTNNEILSRPIILNDAPRNPSAPVQNWVVSLVFGAGSVRRSIVVGRIAEVKAWAARQADAAGTVYSISNAVA